MEPFKKFQNAVKKSYKEKEQLDKLPDLLNPPSPANLRDYSIQRLSNISIEDLTFFKSYFNPRNQFDDIENAIREIDIDKLRPLQNFLNGTTATASEINTKLLAILIDFHPRPYNRKDWTDDVIPESGGEYINTEIGPHHEEKTGQTILPGVEEIEQEDTKQGTSAEGTIAPTPPPIEEEDQDNTTQKTNVENTEGTKGQERLSIWDKIINWLKEKKHQLFIAAPATLVLSLSSGYFMTKKDCMCWNGEKYVEVNCKDKQHANSVIALDIEKLNSFQKIMREDTLSNKDIGKIWYSKINHEVEFFTNAGHHPVHNNRSLRAATAHIIQNYVLNKANRHVAIDSLQINNNEK